MLQFSSFKLKFYLQVAWFWQVVWRDKVLDQYRIDREEREKG